LIAGKISAPFIEQMPKSNLNGRWCWHGMADNIWYYC